MKHMLSVLLFAVTAFAYNLVPQLRVVWVISDPLGCALMDDNTTILDDGRHPRDWEIQSMDSQFAAIAASGANAVIIPLVDEDTIWFAQAGCGFSADPLHRPTAARAVAQEIVISIAAKHNLLVIFQIDISSYRRVAPSLTNSGDNFGTHNGDSGLFDYMWAMMAPNNYYGVQQTTGLQAIGLTNHAVGAYSWTGYFVDDPRVYGWIFMGEVYQVGGVPQDSALLVRYWNWFTQCVHYGYGGQKTMIYTMASYDFYPTAAQANIDGLKQVFATNNLTHPDVLAAQTYAFTSTSLANFAIWTTPLLNMVKSDIWTQGLVGFLEGGSPNKTDPNYLPYYAEVPSSAAQAGAAMLSFFYADDYSSLHKDANQNLDGGCGWSDNMDWDLYTYTVTRVHATCFSVTPPSVGCHTSNYIDQWAYYPPSVCAAPVQATIRHYPGTYTPAGAALTWQWHQW